jgi:type II secretory pathway pseudopilin PulG
MIKKYQNKKQGFSLLESLIYIAILSTMTVLVVNVLLITSRSYNSLKISRNINNSIITSMERMTRDIKSASDIVTAESTFDTDSGRLTVQSSATITEFYLSDGVLRVKENNIDIGPLTQQVSLIDSLTFRLFDSGTTKGVRIEMTMSVDYKNITKTKKFYSFAVLRN